MIDKLIRYARTRLEPLSQAQASPPAIANSLRDIASIYGSSCYRRHAKSYEGRVALVQLGETYGLEPAVSFEAVLGGIESGWTREENWNLLLELGARRNGDDF